MAETSEPGNSELKSLEERIRRLEEKADNSELTALEERIKQLGEKASQLLIFLSFALVVIAVLETQGYKQLGPCQTMLLTFAMRCWVIAIFPIVVGILPVKEIRGKKGNWYNIVRYSKFVLLWLAILCIGIGTIFFICAIWRLGMSRW